MDELRYLLSEISEEQRGFPWPDDVKRRTLRKLDSAVRELIAIREAGCPGCYEDMVKLGALTERHERLKKTVEEAAPPIPPDCHGDPEIMERWRILRAALAEEAK